MISGIGAPASASPTNLITNGTFSQPNVIGNWAAEPNGTVLGWTNPINLDGLEIDTTVVLGMADYNPAIPQSLELNGATFDAAEQTVAGLNTGTSYTLSFGYGDRPGSGEQEMQVLFGGKLVATETDAGTASGWTSESFDVTATATTEILEFIAVNVGGNASLGNEIADVSLAAVSEPASIALLGAGMIGLIRFRGRRA
jgi:hypothetical protein